MKEQDINNFPVITLIKVAEKNRKKLRVGSKRKFNLGVFPSEGSPVRKAREKKSSVGCHMEKIKYDPVTSKVLRIELLGNTGIEIETINSIYYMFPIPRFNS